MLALVKSPGNLAAVAYGPVCSVAIRMWERQASEPVEAGAISYISSIPGSDST